MEHLTSWHILELFFSAPLEHSANRIFSFMSQGILDTISKEFKTFPLHLDSRCLLRPLANLFCCIKFNLNLFFQPKTETDLQLLNKKNFD